MRSLLFLVFLLLYGVVSSDQPRSYFDVPLDPQDRYHVYWQVDYETSVLTMEVVVKVVHQDDWFALGFSDRGEITDADFCVFWVDRHGRAHLQDGWTDDNGFLSVDRHQDCDLSAVTREEDASVLRFAFRRRFDTCDDKDYVIEEGTTHLMYARGPGPLRRLEGLRLSKMEHGFQRVQLTKNLAPEPPLGPDVQSIEILNDHVEVPGDETTYWCSLHKLPPQFRDKHHVVRYEKAIEKGNEGLVHHMEVFHCEVATDVDLPDWNGPCDYKPPALQPCKRVLAAWAMGAPPFPYPEEAGLPIGGDDFSLYLMLEMHYNNPGLKKDWVDSSGLRLYYTSQLRQFDGGVMELGLEYTDKMAIPPDQLDFLLHGYCVSECTRAAIPAEGITIFASQLHTHLTGTGVWTKHIRGGVELPLLNGDNHYSTHFQEIRLLKDRVQLMPGDALITSCRYDTSDRVNITVGGYAISEEMCVNYIHYFPKTDLEVCKSSIDSAVLKSYFIYMNEYNSQPTDESEGISANYGAIDWSANNAELLCRLYDASPLAMQCNQSSGERFPGYWNGIPLTKVLYPRHETPRNCVSDDEDLR